MALIDLTLEKPALKRTEIVESTTSGGGTGSERSTASPTETEPKRREWRVFGAVVGLTVGIVGLVTLQKLRVRRKNRGDE